MEVALAHQDHTWGEWRHDGSHDLWARFLKRLCQYADAKVERGSPRKAHFETIVRKVDVVGRISFPHCQDYIDRLGENLVSVEIKNSNCFAIRGQRTRADAHDETPLRQVIEHRRIDS